MTQLHVPPATESPARAAGHGWLTFGILIMRRRDVLDGLIIYGLLVHGADG